MERRWQVIPPRRIFSACDIALSVNEQRLSCDNKILGEKQELGIKIKPDERSAY